MSKMMRISELTSENLDYLSKKTGKTKIELMEQAIDLLTRQNFFDQLNKGYKELKANKKEWREYQEELENWDANLYDGLNDE